MTASDSATEWLYRCAEREAILTDGRRDVTPEERAQIIREVDQDLKRMKQNEQIPSINPDSRITG